MFHLQKIDPDIIGQKLDLGTYNFSSKDFILYSLGIGFSTDPLNTNDFKYTYQLHKNFTTFPTIAPCFGQANSNDGMLNNPLMPSIASHSILHGEERLYMIHNKIRVGVNYKVESEVIDIIDRGEGKGAFIIYRISGYLINEKGQKDLAYYIDRNVLAKTLGGSGIQSTGELRPFTSIPKRPHDIILKEKTLPNQAILYRLTSDLNTLHIDPEVAKQAKFQRPILHGLATYGIVVRSIVQNLLGNDAQRVKSVEIRFTGHIFPGESFDIKIWQETGRIFFEAQVLERKSKVIVGGIGIRYQARL